MGVWNYGDIIDAVAKVVPASAPALIHGDKTTTWLEFHARTNALARGLDRGGAPTGRQTRHPDPQPAGIHGSDDRRRSKAASSM